MRTHSVEGSEQRCLSVCSKSLPACLSLTTIIPRPVSSHHPLSQLAAVDLDHCRYIWPRWAAFVWKGREVWSGVEWSGMECWELSKQAKIARTSHGFRCCRVAVSDVNANLNSISGGIRYLAWRRYLLRMSMSMSMSMNDARYIR